WLEGCVSSQMPATDAEWDALLRHMALVHALTPERTPVPLSLSVLTAWSAEEANTLVRQQAGRVPKFERPERLTKLLDRFEQMTAPAWPRPCMVLCHADPNITNFIRRPGTWMAVDWENSGWGDAAFEVADLITHPAYLAVPASRWEWVIE